MISRVFLRCLSGLLAPKTYDPLIAVRLLITLDIRIDGGGGGLPMSLTKHIKHALFGVSDTHYGERPRPSDETTGGEDVSGAGTVCNATFTTRTTR